MRKVGKIKYFKSVESARRWAAENLRFPYGGRLSIMRTASDIDGSDRWAISYQEYEVVTQ